MATPAGGIPAAKAQLRAQIRAQRAAAAPAQLAEREQAIAVNAGPLIAAQPPGARVACYLSAPAEPGTNSLVRALIDRGLQVIAPRVRAGQLDWAVVELNSESAIGSFGIREVIGPSVGIDAEPLQRATLIFLPALAIDRRGVRLGQGGGFYDRILALLPTATAGGPTRVAINYQDELLIELPSAPHDCKVDALVTEYAITYIGGETKS